MLPSGIRYYESLDYAGAKAGLELAGISSSPQLWRGVQIMERAARLALNGGV